MSGTPACLLSVEDARATAKQRSSVHVLCGVQLCYAEQHRVMQHGAVLSNAELCSVVLCNATRCCAVQY